MKKPWLCAPKHRHADKNFKRSFGAAPQEYPQHPPCGRIADGSRPWPYVHVDNLAEAVALAVHTARAVGQAYNIVDGQTTVREFTDRFRQWLAVGPLPTRPEVLPWRGHLSGEKAVRELGYRPRVTYEEALAETERYLTESGLITR